MAQIIKNIAKAVKVIYDDFSSDLHNSYDKDNILARLERTMESLKEVLPKDVDCFGISSTIYLTNEEYKEFEKLYKELRRIYIRFKNEMRWSDTVYWKEISNDLYYVLHQIDEAIILILNRIKQ